MRILITIIFLSLAFTLSAQTEYYINQNQGGGVLGSEAVFSQEIIDAENESENQNAASIGKIASNINNDKHSKQIISTYISEDKAFRFLELNSNLEGSYRIELFDIAGNLILNLEKIQSNEIKILKNNFESGTYLVVVTSLNSNLTHESQVNLN